ncbi:ribosomal protein S12 methylthiotransferase accessory factor [Crossiella equi]|uniref:Ribosomal protein S12 methylthiotransferase accessory factor n=1 Tax=Crossiella equi TaxID=130796 RepID=A0ABS5A5I4_9PSEU|nr:ribosomal protein S12 methylthiotransferase accessory factor [Crossiella equi]
MTRLADLTWLDEVGIPCWQAVRPTARTLSVSQGKGATAEQAAISAAMESVEVWHAEHLPDGGITGTARELGDRVGYPLSALRLAPRSVVHEDLPLDWTPANRLTDGAPALVPTQALRLDSTVTGEWAPPAFEVTSNGLASGPSRAAAVLHGLYEVIERDAMASGRQDWQQLDLTRVTGLAAGLLARYRRAGIAVRAYLVPSPMGVPCVEVRATSEEFPVDFCGSAAHLDAATALCRALTEAAQSRVAAIAGTREDLLGELFGQSWTPEEPGPPGHAVLPAPVPPGPAEDLAAELADRVAAHSGYAPLVVDHTRPELGVPVVRVVCPGLSCPDDY